MEGADAEEEEEGVVEEDVKEVEEEEKEEEVVVVEEEEEKAKTEAEEEVEEEEEVCSRSNYLVRPVVSSSCYGLNRPNSSTRAGAIFQEIVEAHSPRRHALEAKEKKDTKETTEMKEMKEAAQTPLAVADFVAIMLGAVDLRFVHKHRVETKDEALSLLGQMEESAARLFAWVEVGR